MLETCLIDRHEALGARLVDFNGWRMPIQYSSIVEEHHAVRQRAGLFDLGHMGRLRLDGPGAVDFMHKLLTLDARAMFPTRVGMNRGRRNGRRVLRNVPHTCGDEPS